MSTSGTFIGLAEAYGGRPVPTRELGVGVKEHQRCGFTAGEVYLELIHQETGGRHPMLEPIQESLVIEAAVAGARQLGLTIGRGLIRRALGRFRSVDTGDPAFDRAFVVHARDRELARLWLSAEFREAHLASPRRPVRLAAGVLRYELARPGDAGDLAAGIRAAAALAGRAAVIAADLRALAAEIDATSPEGSWDPDDWVMTMKRGACLLRLDHLLVAADEPRAAHGLRTRVRAERISPELGGLVVHRRGLRRTRRPAALATLPAAPLVAAQSGRWVAQATLPGAARGLLAGCARLLDKAAPDAIEADASEVTIILPGAPLDHGRLRAAVDLAHALAGGSPADGPYR